MCLRLACVPLFFHWGMGVPCLRALDRLFKTCMQRKCTGTRHATKAEAVDTWRASPKTIISRGAEMEPSPCRGRPHGTPRVRSVRLREGVTVFNQQRTTSDIAEVARYHPRPHA